MKFGCLSSALLAVLVYSETGLGFTGGSTGQVATYVKWRAPTAVKRQISIGGDGGLTLPGGLTLGGKGNKGGASAANSTAAAAKGQGKQGQSTSLGDLIAAATGAARNQTGAATGKQGQGNAAAKQGEGAGQAVGQAAAGGEGKAGAAPATGEGAAKEGKATAAEPKAVTESEQFSENAGITLGADGTAQNLGGNLGITKGSDGSQSVGGKSGINISPAAAPAAAPATAPAV